MVRINLEKSIDKGRLHIGQILVNPNQYLTDTCTSIKKKQLYGPFLWMGFNCLKATATSRRQFTFYHLVPRNSWYSFYQPQKDERLRRPWSHPVVLNTGFSLYSLIIGNYWLRLSKSCLSLALSVKYWLNIS